MFSLFFFLFFFSYKVWFYLKKLDRANFDQMSYQTINVTLSEMLDLMELNFEF